MWGRSWGRIIVGGLLVVIGGGWLLESAGILDFPLRALAPLALIGIGVGLVIGSRHGSYPGLIVIGIVITVLLAGGSDWDRSGGVRERRFGPFGRIDIRRNEVVRPRNASDLRPYRIDAGRLTIDLTRLRLDDETYEVEARVDAGELRVIVPPDVPMHVEARSDVGNVEILGDQRSRGVSADQDFESPDYDEARPRFELDLRVGVGSIHVTREGAD